LDNYLF